MEKESISKCFNCYRIEFDLKSISKLLNHLTNKMDSPNKLFPDLNESEIDWVYKMSLPDESSLK